MCSNRGATNCVEQTLSFLGVFVTLCLGNVQQKEKDSQGSEVTLSGVVAWELPLQRPLALQCRSHAPFVGFLRGGCSRGG